MWVPSVYTSPGMYLVNHPVNLGTQVCVSPENGIIRIKHKLVTLGNVIFSFVRPLLEFLYHELWSMGTSKACCTCIGYWYLHDTSIYVLDTPKCIPNFPP